MVNTRIKRFEEKGYLSVNKYYLLQGGQEASLEEVQPAVDRALETMGLKREFQAYANKELRNQFLDLRDDFYYAQTEEHILCKRFEIHALVPIEEACEEGEAVPDLTNKDIQIILTSFFDIFREKLLFDIEQQINTRIWKKRTSVAARNRIKQLQRREQEVKEIVQTYCAYMNNPLHKEPRAFYSLDELQDYYQNLGETGTALDYDHIPDYAKQIEEQPESAQDLLKYEMGDQTGAYDEISRNGKDLYDFYKLSNMADKRGEPQEKKRTFSTRRWRIEEYVPGQYDWDLDDDTPF